MKFLNGFRNPRVALPLASYGFGQATLDEGWTLLRAVVGETFSVPVRVPPPDPTLLARLDAWENRWLKVAEATLRRHYPDIAERVFLNLSRTTGIEVVASVTTFLDRVEPLADGDEAEKSARALLAERGLTDEVVAEAKRSSRRSGRSRRRRCRRWIGRRSRRPRPPCGRGTASG
ncbi:MAG: hypothetical protein R3B72_51670 [Polyangiaceae bacterium]